MTAPSVPEIRARWEAVRDATFYTFANARTNFDANSFADIKALLQRVEELETELAERMSDDVKRSEGGRTDWDYETRIGSAERGTGLAFANFLSDFFTPDTVQEIRAALGGGSDASA